MTLKKILVALDRSAQSLAVFEKALEIGHNEECQLLLFHSLSKDPEGQWAPFIGTLADIDLYGSFHQLQRKHFQQEIEKAHSWLQTYCHQAILKNIPSELDCQLGDAGSLICETAQNWGADLIVLGRRGHQGLSELLLGSVSNYVVHHAPCSVLIVQGIIPEKVNTPATTTQADRS
ncbi:universal stress protein [Allocoleopsis sp.]|uniref:universal stress protein n=1 Tax=Allocoleopsis sp. TaxID=3088169 RepID=UPI002FD6260D